MSDTPAIEPIGMPFTIIVGTGYDRDGFPLPESVRTLGMRMRDDACTRFGGYTIAFDDGGWADPVTGNLIHEPVYRITVITDPGNAETVYNYAHQCGAAFRQASVVVMAGNTANLIHINPCV